MSGKIFVASLIAGLALRRVFPKFLVFDTIFVVAIIFVLGVNTFLGTTLNLNAPYLNAIKYDYQALPFFCLLAASLITKSISLFNSGKTKPKLNKIIFFLVASAGFILVTSTLLYNMRYVYLLAGWNYLLFRVEPNVNLGYSLFNSSPIGADSVMMGLQFFGFAIALSGIIWASRHRISFLFKLSRRALREKRIGNSFESERRKKVLCT